MDEDDLYKYWLFGSTRKEDLIEGIESVIDEFDDYIRLEGSDGSFSKEIYEYLIALNELKIVISKWEVDVKELKKRRKVLKDSRSKVTD